MQDTDATLPVAVIGVGRMGRHHARTYHNLAGAELSAVVDHDLQRAEALAEEYGCAAYPSVDAMLAERAIKAATIAVPTQHHAAAARPLIERGIACLIEKPIAGSVKQAAELIAFAKEHRCVLQVGHTERFNPAVRALSALSLTPRYIEVCRVSPMTFRSMDVGVVMDMMIHDLDIVIALVDRPLAKVEAVGASILGEHEDVCDARLTFEGGCVVSIKGSRMATGTTRTLKLFADDAYVSLDYGTREGVVIRTGPHAEALAETRKKLAEGDDLSHANYLDMLTPEPLSIDLPADETDQLTAQAKAFLQSVRDDSTPVVTGEQAAAAVDAAERIVSSMRRHAWDGRAAIAAEPGQ
ncbi:MAG: Gfo/Idh/MocA family oxidoreductase [Phycisphaeraceae bacterium]